MPSFEDRLKKHFGNSLPEGEKLYTKENLKAVEEIKSLINGDLSEILHQLIILDLKTRLTKEGQKRLDNFFKLPVPILQNPYIKSIRNITHHWVWNRTLPLSIYFSSFQSNATLLKTQMNRLSHSSTLGYLLALLPFDEEAVELL